MKQSTQLRILLVDDHEIVRLGLKALLMRYPHFQVVAEAGDAEEAMAQAQLYRPDVIVMDVRLPGKSGIEATQAIKATLPETDVVILTSYADDELVFDAIRAGASGYVLKQIGGDRLVQALESLMRGEPILDHRVTLSGRGPLAQVRRPAERSVFSILTDQELRILALLTEGKSNKEIARELKLSSGTVRNYVSVLMEKLQVANRAEAAAYAVQHHIWQYMPDAGQESLLHPAHA